MQINPDDVLMLMKERRSIREFEDKAIPSDIIDRILEAGQWCQSANNNQPWRFIVISNRVLINSLAKMATYGHFIAQAPIVIAIVADKKRAPKWYIHDTSMVAHQMCLMAWACGIGTCWIGSLERDDASILLKLASHEYLTTILPLGYPKKIGKSNRKDLTAIVTRMD